LYACWAGAEPMNDLEWQAERYAASGEHEGNLAEAFRAGALAATREGVRLELNSEGRVVLKVPTGGAPSARHPDGHYEIAVDETNIYLVASRILREQARSHIAERLVGHAAAPTQTQVEEWIRQHGVERIPGVGKAAPKPRELSLEDLDL
jgi:hypothetical protein